MNTLSHTREMEVRIIRSNFAHFCKLVARADNLLEKDRYDEAALCVEAAACFAARRHCGLFVSSGLERILVSIGKKLQSEKPHFGSSNLTTVNPRKVLHVSTTVRDIGGHSRMLLRWIRQDAKRTHSLALTRQVRSPVPEKLKAAVRDTGGCLYRINEKRGGLLSWARELKHIASSEDLVVLHITSDDVVPLVAFADRTDSPPVVFLDHADHLFWLGAAISDLVIALRESGMRLAQQRRYISPERSVLLPIILEPTQRLLSRAEAKRRIGLPEDSVLLLSVAREVKYSTMQGVTYADAHVPVLEKHRRAILMIVGSGTRDDWKPAIDRTQGRIIPLHEQEDVSTFQQAADIYVDSYPSSSNTSMLEAGSYGVPLVTRTPFSSASDILWADTPGFAATVWRASTDDQYVSMLSRLIKDSGLRRELGNKTMAAIHRTHTGCGWQQKLEEVYECAVTARTTGAYFLPEDRQSCGELDALILSIHGQNTDLAKEALDRLRSLPMRERVANWWKLTRKRQDGVGVLLRSMKPLVPEWLVARILQRGLYPSKRLYRKCCAGFSLK